MLRLHDCTFCIGAPKYSYAYLVSSQCDARVHIAAVVIALDLEPRTYMYVHHVANYDRSHVFYTAFLDVKYASRPETTSLITQELSTHNHPHRHTPRRTDKHLRSIRVSMDILAE